MARLKDGIDSGVVTRRAVKPGSRIQRKEVVLLGKIRDEGPVVPMRRIGVWVANQQETIMLPARHLKPTAATVAAV